MTTARLCALRGLALAVLLALGLARPPAAYPAAGSASAPPEKFELAPAEAMKTVAGVIKGAPTGTVYTVLVGKRSLAVDARKAVVRMAGRPRGTSDLKPGLLIRATGSMNGATLIAKTVDIIRAAGGPRK